MSIGTALSEARQQAGLTVAQLSHRTRIREAIIYGIERDDFSASGGDFYLRGHIRAIAKEVALDPEAIVREYDDQHGGNEEPVRAATVFKLDGSLKIRERRSANWTMAMGVALAIVVVFGIVRLMGGPGESGDKTKARVSPAAVPGGRPSPASERKPVRAVSDVVVVKATAKKSSWINVRDANGKQLFQGTITRGKASTWKARDQVRVVIENAGAIRLEVNGEDVGTLGKSGQTVRRTFGPGSPRPR